MLELAKRNQLAAWIIGAVLLCILPFVVQMAGNAWVRIIDIALLYVLLALGLNIVVGYAGLLDLGYVAFYAVGAYMLGLLASSQLPDHFPAVAGAAGVLLGAPTLKLRGDYLAIVTLGFGEIVRVFLNNLDAPVNITNGPKGITGIDEITILGTSLGKTGHWFGLEWPKVTNYYFLLLVLVVISVIICYRLERSRIGRAWMAIREDEIAAKAMGINTRNMKLLAFGMGATLGGVSGVMFGAFQGFISPESFSLPESVMIVAMVVLGGIGHLPGVIVGALLLAALPEVLRYVAGPLQQWSDGRLDASILRQLLIALAMIGIMLARPRGLWPSPEHGKQAPTPAPPKTRDDPSVPQPVGPNVSEVTNESHPSGTRHA